MLVTEFGMTVVLHPTINSFEAVSIMALQSFRESNVLLPEFTTMLVRLGHQANAREPMLVTEFGISMLVRPEQSTNAPSPMLVTEFGMTILVRPEQEENALRPMLVTE